MLRQARINPRRQISQRTNLSYNAWLRENVIILYAVEHFREAPEGIRFDGVEDRFGELAGVHAGGDIGIGDVAAEEDLPEGGDEVVDALDVAAGRVADRPDVEDPFQGALGCFVAI